MIFTDGNININNGFTNYKVICEIYYSILFLNGIRVILILNGSVFSRRTATSIAMMVVGTPMPIRIAMSMRTTAVATAMSIVMVLLRAAASSPRPSDFSVTMAIRYCNNFVVKSENKDCPCSLCLTIYVYKICVVNDNLC